ncbi:MAG: polysulfide reductase [Myxococcales bacterium FL481]|nr:MAG: polysulfide reductase [Myxococcales bacterium FL481]
MLGCVFRGSRGYWIWMAGLAAGMAAGGIAYSDQIEHGLAVTHLSDQVSWGAYIANFTYLVGVAAASVLLVVPTYVYHRQDLKQVVLIGELLAVSAIVMCLGFVVVDLGHPERGLHMLPGIGRLNFPSSILAWDVIVLNGYLLLNLHVPGYLLYQEFRGRTPRRRYYLPWVLISILWAVSIHTVTAFLYSGFGGRPFWNTAILAPRFLVSAFASGPALLIIAFYAINRTGAFHIGKSVFVYLRRVMSFTLPLNFFLLGCELFAEFYTDSAHVMSAEYLFFGIHGHGLLVPYIWSGLGMGLVAMVIVLTPPLHTRPGWLAAACLLTVVGVWVEKGMGLIVPGFVPSPAGDLVEYAPSAQEFWVSLGIWCFGAALFTVMAKVALAIKSGRLRAADAPPHEGQAAASPG